ncbi:MAG: N-glycosylase/DNA lyase [Candidatus ainarchaeum sp.]|nr:N-glycosylase/DNA lyase [Candidatus ainarchaeum sp.]
MDKKTLEEYEEKKFEIRKRLLEFKEKWHTSDKEVFAELAFCLCTPQSKAKNCDAAVKELIKNKKLFNSNSKEISKTLWKKVRFHNNKSKYIVEARKKLMPKIRDKLIAQGIYSDIPKAREWLVKNIKGLGMKEASHFLRNTGFFEDIAILDRHILKNLKKAGAIKKIPQALSHKKYIEIEKEMQTYSKKTGIPMQELDLLFWSRETGEIFR